MDIDYKKTFNILSQMIEYESFLKNLQAENKIIIQNATGQKQIQVPNGIGDHRLGSKIIEAIEEEIKDLKDDCKKELSIIFTDEEDKNKYLSGWGEFK